MSQPYRTPNAPDANEPAPPPRMSTPTRLLLLLALLLPPTICLGWDRLASAPDRRAVHVATIVGVTGLAVLILGGKWAWRRAYAWWVARAVARR
jgi:hypothetical protein